MKHKNPLVSQFNSALNLHKEGKLEEAKTIYNSILKSEPQHTNSLNNIGIIFAQQNDFNNSEIFFKKAIDSNPKFLEAYMNIGNLYKKNGDENKSKNYFIEALKIKISQFPDNSLFLLNDAISRGFFIGNNFSQIESKEKQLPLLTWPFLDFIQTLDISSNKLYELGAGNSTNWFAKIYKEIISYETNQKFYESLKKNLLKNVNLSLVTLENIYNCDFSFNNQDWLLIDFAGKRTKFVNKLIQFEDSSLPAQIIFDNSDTYRVGANLLIKRGYFEIPFYGKKSGENIYSSTSLFLLKNKFEIRMKNDFYRPMFSKKIKNGWDVIE